jgi:Fe-S-cluster containining protein
MPLLEIDIENIKELGFDEHSFIVERRGIKYLKNKKGKCFFLTEKCSIYNKRPEGCKLYPVIFDSTTENIILDRLCPHYNHFRVTFKKSLRMTKLYRTVRKS